jgi:hypothetical protein
VAALLAIKTDVPAVGWNVPVSAALSVKIKEASMDTTTLLIIILVLLLLFGGGWYGRGRWY